MPLFSKHAVHTRMFSKQGNSNKLFDKIGSSGKPEMSSSGYWLQHADRHKTHHLEKASHKRR